MYKYTCMTAVNTIQERTESTGIYIYIYILNKDVGVILKTTLLLL